MPHTASAAKRLRQSLERRTRNKMRVTQLQTISKKIQRAVKDGKKDEAQSLYRDLSQRLDQAASANVIHKNHAARAKSRMAKQLSAPAAKAKA